MKDKTMGIEEQLDQKLDDLKEEWMMSQLPRAVSLTSHLGNLYKLYTDGTMFKKEDAHSSWKKVSDDGYLKEKLKEIKKGLATS